MRDVQELIETFIARKIIIGPGHFVLGDGFGNPGMHSGLFVDPDRFYQSFDLHEECLRRIAEQLGELRVDLIVTPDDQSLPTARLLARILAGNYRVPMIPVSSMESGPPPETRGNLLIHDDVISRGRQAQVVLEWLEKAGLRPFAVSSLFTRIQDRKIHDLPIIAAVDRPIAAVPEEDCPLCEKGVPVDPDYGKGALYLALLGGQLLPIKVPRNLSGC